MSYLNTQKLIEYLMCRSTTLDDALDALGFKTTDIYWEEVSDAVFYCVTCGEWFPLVLQSNVEGQCKGCGDHY